MIPARSVPASAGRPLRAQPWTCTDARIVDQPAPAQQGTDIRRFGNSNVLASILTTPNQVRTVILASSLSAVV
jgi:hypothetical protein